MIDYRLLSDSVNNCLNEYLEDNYLKDFALITSLNDIIARNITNIKVRDYDEKVGLEDSVNFAYSFFQTLSQDYANYFEKRLNDGTIYFSEKFEESQSYYDSKANKRVIEVIKTDTIEDAFVIVHELLHDLNLKPEKNFPHRLLFTETISMLGELLFKDFLSKNLICMKDNYKTPILDTISVNNMAITNSLDLELINKFLINGYVSINDLKEICKNNDEDVITFCMNYLFDTLTLSIDYNQRYIIGELLSNYMYERIQKNPKYLCELIETNDMMNDNFLDQLISYLDLDMEDDEYLLLSNNSLKTLEKCYQRKLKHLYIKH